MELFLIRHGESVGNILVDQDAPDSNLTDKGLKQAIDLANILFSTEDIDTIYSSPLLRSLSTAQPLAELSNKRINVVKELCEYRSGKSYIGPSLSTLKNLYPSISFDNFFEEDGWFYPSNDTPEIAINKARRFIKYLLHHHKGEKVMVFAHGTINHYILKASLNLDNQICFDFHQDNCCVNHLDFTDEHIKVIKINECILKNGGRSE